MKLISKTWSIGLSERLDQANHRLAQLSKSRNMNMISIEEYQSEKLAIIGFMEDLIRAANKQKSQSSGVN